MHPKILSHCIVVGNIIHYHKKTIAVITNGCIVIKEIKDFCIIKTCEYLYNITQVTFQYERKQCMNLTLFSQNSTTSKPLNTPCTSKQKLIVEKSQLILPDQLSTYSCL